MRRALLVDDDPLVRMVVAGILDTLGFEVIEAEDGKEALAALSAERGIDVLVTDVLMPRLDGWTLAEQARLAHPELPVIYVTGYYHENARPVPGGSVIRKPFRITKFAEVLGELLSAS